MTYTTAQGQEIEIEWAGSDLKIVAKVNTVFGEADIPTLEWAATQFVAKTATSDFDRTRRVILTPRNWRRFAWRYA